MKRRMIQLTTAAFSLGVFLVLASVATGQETAPPDEHLKIILPFDAAGQEKVTGDKQMMTLVTRVPPTFVNLLYFGSPERNRPSLVERQPLITMFRNAGIELVDGSTVGYDPKNCQFTVTSNQAGVEQVDQFLTHLGWKLVNRRDYKGDILFAALDDNGNGKIDKEEIEKATELLHALDKNADGEIAGNELLPNESQ